MNVELTQEEAAAICSAAGYAVEDQEHWLDCGDPQIDYGDEWEEVAANKAEDFHNLASALRKLDFGGMADSCDTLAEQFTEEAGLPGLCVTCGTRCEARDDLSVICPKCEKEGR